MHTNIFQPLTDELQLQRDVESVKRCLDQRYGIEVKLVDHNVPSEVEIASWRNQQLVIRSRANHKELAFYLICHVFGHLVQYAVSPYTDLLAVIETQVPPIAFPPGYREAYFGYEQEAFRLGAGLMLAAGVDYRRYDQAYQAFMRADFELYWSYLAQGIKTTDADLVARFESYRHQPAGELRPLMPPRTRFALTDQCINVA